MERRTPTLDSGSSSGELPGLYAASPARPADAPTDMPARARRQRRRVLLWTVLALLAVTVLPVALLRVLPAWTSSFMLRHQIEQLFGAGESVPLRHQWVSWKQIAPSAKLAVIAAEDQRFADHMGLDFQAIERAIEHNRQNRRTRGASTITQQLAKNLFLWPERTWVRKGLETGYTLLIELMWPKQRVLEVYLNVVEFGPGVYGVEAAAQTYFRKHASQLTYPEAALLAAVLPNPRRFRVDQPTAYVENRAAWIRSQMNRIGGAVLEKL